MEEHEAMNEIDGYVNGVYPLAFAANTNVVDTPNHYQLMNCPDLYLFIDAMVEEIKALEVLEAWEMIDLGDVPYAKDGCHMTVIDSTYAFN
eukprot:14266978-Ditylum_brightwellii.AAC.1